MSAPISEAESLSFVTVADQITASFASARELLQSTLAKARSSEDFDVKDGISLLSLKNDILLSYLQSIVLLSSHRILGHSLLDRTPPSESFASAQREPRGEEAGDLVDSAVEARAVLEKIKPLEARMKYQIQKLVRVAEDTVSIDADITHDPLAFRPNLENFVDNENPSTTGHPANDEPEDGIYRPPKLAPVPYTEQTKGEKAAARRAQRAAPTALTTLAHLDPSMPFVESTSGLGMAPSTSAARARVDRLTEFEESNMTRLLMNKKATKQRLRDEADVAMGAMGGGRGRRGGGLDEEFDDVLKGIRRNKNSRGGDGYEELRQRGKKQDVLSRSRVREREEDGGGSGGPGGRPKKRGKFEQAVMGVKRKEKRAKR